MKIVSIALMFAAVQCGEDRPSGDAITVDGGGPKVVDAAVTVDGNTATPPDAADPNDAARQDAMALSASALPGDIAAAANTPLVAAHSVTRPLFAAYNGKLFQARRASDGMTQDIGVAMAGGLVDSNAVNSFCSATTCSVAVLYDQTGNGNHLTQGSAGNQPTVQFYSLGNGQKIPMASSLKKQWLRNRANTKKIPINADPQTEYFVVNGKIFNNGCCYDYGNMEAKIHDDGAGTMNALYFGSDTFWGSGAGAGPWGKVDMENGVFAGAAHNNPQNPTTVQNLVTVLTKTDGTKTWALKVGDPSTGSLNTYWKGALPNGYSPMKQEGGLSLGEGGDGSNAGIGAFFEGVVIAAVTSDATDALIQANIASVYGQ